MLESRLGKGDRALWLLMLWIIFYLHTDFGPLSIYFLLHQFLFLYWITQTNGTTIPPPKYYLISLSPFLAKLHRRVSLFPISCSSFPFCPLFVAIRLQPHHFTEMVLAKVLCNFRLAWMRPNLCFRLSPLP